MVKMPLGFLLKHLVPVLFVFEEHGKPRALVMSAFVLSVDDQWFLVTAGHCIAQVQELLASSGWSLKRCCLLDSLHLDTEKFDAVPFVYLDAHPCRVDDSDFGLDYGILVLSPYYRTLLETNGIQALSEPAWKSPPDDPDSYWLLGLPEELIQVDFDSESVFLEPLA